ncbi:ABC transporter substrate-binding protein [Brevibacterium marinum]|uniref:Branched-chain amino acid transport system substrate-binding protein n=1 Tax=Brevibacterium marinum TaxID=418643 RepID=A0A846S0D2_9MICO|nr:ABC transporter substrate-binding protein [Brevibacterium marinum]NJC57135.1 branched-chain amino acid transport system substrate-binding protein [Brevibacterium marinum]
MISFSRRVSRPVLAAAVIGTFALTLGACGSSGDSGGDDSVVIGYTGPLSGGGAAYGENVQTGLQMAVDDLNEDGLEVDGKKVTIELESLDDKYAPSTAASNAQRLADQDEAPVVVSPNAGAIKAIQQINNGRSKFLIAAYTSDPAIMQVDNPLTMMIPPNFESYAAPYTEQGMKHGGEKLALLGTQSEYGQQWTEAITDEWEKAGGEIGSDNSVDYATVSDFAGPVSKALAEKPDSIFVGGPSQPTALIMEQARKQGFEGSFLVMDQAKLDEMATVTEIENLTNSIGVLPVKEYDDPGNRDFLKKYADVAGDDKVATSETALNYQSVAVIAKAMEVAGTTSEPEKIRAAIPDALSQVDDKYKVNGFPTEITGQGHLMNPELEVTHLDENEKYVKVPVDQVSDVK